MVSCVCRATTFKFNIDEPLTLQFINRMYPTPEAAIQEYDLDLCRFYYDGTHVGIAEYATYSAEYTARYFIDSHPSLR